MMLMNLPRPAVIAHRGASAYAPENTLAAFELAIDQGADAIELDAKLSADGEVVVIHDRTVNRTTTGSGRVGEMTLKELRALDAGSFFDITYQGEKIPTLNEVFALVGKRIPINVELTNYASLTDDLPDKVAALVRRHNLTRQVLFSSFNPLALLRIRRLLPEVPVGMLALPGWKGGWARSWVGRLTGYQSLHPEASDVTPALVRKAHARGERVLVWTVNEAQEMERLFKLGVDGIFTDDPPLARKVLHSIEAGITHAGKGKVGNRE